MTVASIATRVMRWTVTGPFGGEMNLYVATREACHIAVPDIGSPVCRTHNPSTSECLEAMKAVLAQRLKDSYPEEGN